MEMVFICHPYRDDPEGNRKKVGQIVRDIVIENPDILPLAPQLYLYQLDLYDRVLAERELLMDMSLYLLEACDELWFFGNRDAISEGMEQEIQYAHKHKIPVITK